MTITIRRLMWRELRHRKLSFVLAVLAVGAACATVVSVLAVLQRHTCQSRAVLVQREADLRDQLARYDDSLRRSMQHLGFNVLIIPGDQDLTDFYADDYAAATMPETVLNDLVSAHVMTVEHLAARLRQKILWPERNWTVQIVGTADTIANPSQDSRELVLQTPPPGTVDLGAELAAGLTIKPGDRIDIRGKPFTVRHCLPETGTTDDITVWMPLEDAQDVLGKQGRINEILALECRTAWQDLPKVRAEIAQTIPGVQVIEKRSETLAKVNARELMAREGQALLERERQHQNTVLRSEHRLGTVVITVAVAVAALWVGLITVLNVRSRRVEVGILRANGLGQAGVTALFAWRSIVAAVLGAALGFAGAVIFTGFPGWLRATFWFGASLGVAALIAVLAGMLPVLRALRIDPALVLTHEY